MIKGMGIPILEFMREYKFSAGYTKTLFKNQEKYKKRKKLF